MPAPPSQWETPLDVAADDDVLRFLIPRALCESGEMCCTATHHPYNTYDAIKTDQSNTG